MIKDVAQFMFLILLMNIVFSLFLYSWVTDNDITNLPKNKRERFMAILYFTITTSTSTGYGDIVPKSVRARIASSMLQVFMFAVVVKRILEK
jgi:hypothetical protein